MVVQTLELRAKPTSPRFKFNFEYRAAYRDFQKKLSQN